MPVASISNARKAGIVVRIASQQIRRTRTYGAVARACRTTANHCSRILHQLWLEVTGFVFLALASIGGLAFAREYMKLQAGKPVLARVVVAICFTLIFGWFGLTSFWRIRQKQK